MAGEITLLYYDPAAKSIEAYSMLRLVPWTETVTAEVESTGNFSPTFNVATKALASLFLFFLSFFLNTATFGQICLGTGLVSLLWQQLSYWFVFVLIVALIKDSLENLHSVFFVWLKSVLFPFCVSPLAHLHVVGMLWFIFWHKPTVLAHFLLFCSCVYFCDSACRRAFKVVDDGVVTTSATQAYDVISGIKQSSIC